MDDGYGADEVRRHISGDRDGADKVKRLPTAPLQAAATGGRGG